MKLTRVDHNEYNYKLDWTANPHQRWQSGSMEDC